MLTRGEQMLELRRRRMAESPPFLRGGFRPFFFGGAAWALVALVAWLVIPQFVACLQLLLAKIPTAIALVTDWLKQQQLMTAEIAAWLEGWNWKSAVARADTCRPDH